MDEKSSGGGVGRECCGVRKRIRKVQMNPTDTRTWKSLGLRKVFNLQVQHLAVFTRISHGTHLLGFKRRPKDITKASLVAGKIRQSHRGPMLVWLCMFDIMLCCHRLEMQVLNKKPCIFI